MDEALQAHLAALGHEVVAAAIPEGTRRTAAWCLGQLPALYAKFHQTSERRYGDEITRLVQAVLKALAASQGASPATPHLAAGLTDRLRLFHEQFGLPALNLQPVGASLRSRKAG